MTVFFVVVVVADGSRVSPTVVPVLATRRRSTHTEVTNTTPAATMLRRLSLEDTWR